MRGESGGTVEAEESTIDTPLARAIISTNYQQSPGRARIAVFTVRHFISFDFTPPRQREVNGV